MMESRTPSRRDPNPHIELWLMVGVLMIGAFLRFYAPNAMPPGPSHDELRMMDLGELIVEGERPIHWKITYSAEPLYMYLLALAMPIWGFTPFGARLVTRFAGLLLIPVAHRLTRRLFDRRSALFTSGVLAMTWWPLFFSRVALRGITLPLVFSGAVICLWRGLDLGGRGRDGSGSAIRWRWLTAGGGLMGLTWYTFTAARGLVVLLPMLLIYLGLLDVMPLGQLWRVAVVTIGAASLIVAPFVYEVQVHPGTPESRLDQLGGIIDQLMAGNFLPFVKQAVNTAGLFIVRGDPNWRYNIAGRPIFGPLLGTLAILGVALSVGRWRQPRHAILVAWSLLGLAPSMLTPEAPSYVRGIGALPVVAVFPAIGAVTLWDWIATRADRRLTRLVVALLILLVAVNGLGTFRDAFVAWRARPEVREIYQASLTQAFHDLTQSNLEGPLWISEPFPDDRHILLAKRMLSRGTIEPRWFNANRALILPSADGARRYVFADFVEPDEELLGRWMSDAVAILEAPSRSGSEPTYRVYQVNGGPWVERELSKVRAQSTAYLDLEAARSVALPARFGSTAELLGYELTDDALEAGEDVHLTVYWRVDGPVFEPIASFAHLMDVDEEIVGQYDGFDVPPWEWEPGAVVAQVYGFPIDRDAEPGTHWIQVGLYNSQTMARLQVVGKEGVSLGERLVLETVTVE